MNERGFSNQTVQVLSAFATSVQELHKCIEYAVECADDPYYYYSGGSFWGDRAAGWALAAVRAARMLEVREEYR